MGGFQVFKLVPNADGLGLVQTPDGCPSAFLAFKPETMHFGLLKRRDLGRSAAGTFGEFDPHGTGGRGAAGKEPEGARGPG